LTPIALAAKEGHLQIVEYLADHKADIDYLNLEDCVIFLEKLLCFMQQ